MRYSKQAEGKTTKTRMRECSADDDMVAIVFRIPENLKLSAQEEARNRGMSFSVFVRMSMMAELAKSRAK